MSNGGSIRDSLRIRLGCMLSTLRYAYYALKTIKRQTHSPESFTKLKRIFKLEGCRGVVKRLRISIEINTPAPSKEISLDDYKDSYAAYKVTPFYVNQQLDHETDFIRDDQSICIHLNISTLISTSTILKRLSGIPVKFDLFITTSQGDQEKRLSTELTERLPRAKRIFIKKVSASVEVPGLVAMVAAFGKSIVNYDIVGHFSCTEAPSRSIQERLGCETVLDHLLGPIDASGGRIAFYLRELKTRTKLIIAERELEVELSIEIDSKIRNLVSDLIGHCNSLSIEDFSCLDYPAQGMFWGRTECIRDLMSIPMVMDRFGGIAQFEASQLNEALKRAVMLAAIPYAGRFLRITKGDSLKDYRYFEDQQDYRDVIVNKEIKVLSYYLPQFHPIPENDQWHGKGFTEWNNVNSSTPLYQGHYQQHIPHEDIGCYKIESPEILRLQSELMQKAGVHGQIFYHYWFSGKLILEKPAQMLLENPDIPMPFCFCWANENWTRRWDGNSNEILLGQTYSEMDAIDFIEYLLPFFEDDRYIKVNRRPLLLIYRPSSIPNISTYLNTWKDKCRAVGLATPYLVAVLTRGATSPVDYGMDAGAERVLHDWSHGAVPDISHALNIYEPFYGSILPYEDVSKHYMEKNEFPDYEYFQSIVPMWDNTARYGKNAYIVHGSTPELFQLWLEEVIAQSSKRLPSDRRFVLINAWNEWSEGAHLEPDSQYGYSYLNSVGRALSERPYPGAIDRGSIPGSNLRIHIHFSDELIEQLQADGDLAKRCLFGLIKSPLSCNIFFSAEQQLVIRQDADLLIGCADEADLVFEFRRAAVFDPQLLGILVETALANQESVVIPNTYGSDEALIVPATNGSVYPIEAAQSPIILYAPNTRDCRRFRFIMEPKALCFITVPNTLSASSLPKVTVVIRIHKDANLDLLANALGCLSAMQDCVCVPLIAAQDLITEQVRSLKSMLNYFLWHQDFQPQILYYTSPNGRGDLRARMLNQSLRKVKTKYAAVLDYDDLLMPFAYSVLLSKLHSSGKAVAFGRVYRSLYDTKRRLIIDRAKRFEYGYAYSDFLAHNCVPIHSFIVHAEALQLEGVAWHEDQRFMEDYFLTLQLFSKGNADWRGLRDNFYIGDYIHSIDRAHTLAFYDDRELEKLHGDEVYLLCLQRIQELQRSKRRC